MSDLGASSPLTCELRGACLFLGAACWVHATQEIFLRDQRCKRSPPGRVFDDFADLVYGRRRLLRPATWLTTRSASLRHAFRYRCRPCRLFPWLIRYEGLDARLKLIERLSEWLVCRFFSFVLVVSFYLDSQFEDLWNWPRVRCAKGRDCDSRRSHDRPNPITGVSFLTVLRWDPPRGKDADGRDRSDGIPEILTTEQAPNRTLRRCKRDQNSKIWIETFQGF